MLCPIESRHVQTKLNFSTSFQRVLELNIRFSLAFVRHYLVYLQSSDAMTSVIKFGPFTVTSQVFYKTAYTFCLVNLKPILPGHVLVCPLRPISRLSQLTPVECADFFATVQKVSGVIEKQYSADALNVAIQDGPLAGQTVPHVHCHIIPRRLNDLENSDQVYKLLNSADGDLEKTFAVLKDIGRNDARFDRPDSDRIERTMSEMEQEAEMLSKLF